MEYADERLEVSEEAFQEITLNLGVSSGDSTDSTLSNVSPNSTHGLKINQSLKDDRNINGKRVAVMMDSDDEIPNLGRSSCETPEEEERRLKANEQERSRMQRFNSALNNLRNCIPNHFRLGSRRLSKIRTLRLAISYIAALQDILKKDCQSPPKSAQQATARLAAFSDFGITTHDMNFDGTIQTPSRISLREMAERGLVHHHSDHSSFSVSPVMGVSWSARRDSAGTTSGESSDESFISDQRFLCDSPENLPTGFFGSRNFFQYNQRSDKMYNMGSSDPAQLTGLFQLRSLPDVSADLPTSAAWMDSAACYGSSGNLFDYKYSQSDKTKHADNIHELSLVPWQNSAV